MHAKNWENESHGFMLYHESTQSLQMSEATICGDMELYNLYLSSTELQEIDSDKEEDECETLGNCSLVINICNVTNQNGNRNQSSDQRVYKCCNPANKWKDFKWSFQKTGTF